MGFRRKSDTFEELDRETELAREFNIGWICCLEALGAEDPVDRSLLYDSRSLKQRRKMFAAAMGELRNFDAKVKESLERQGLSKQEKS